MWRELWDEYRQRHPGKVFGVIGGLGIGLLVITLGFWRTLFLAACVFVGYQVGKRADDGEDDITQVIDRFLPPSR